MAPSGKAARSGPRVLLSEADVSRTIARIAHQIIERTAPEPVVLLGIPTRGVHLARRLAERVTAFGGPAPSTGILDVTLYRDDLRRRPNRPLAETSLPVNGVDDRVIVLVDDVLYSGRTVRAALDALRDHGRPRAIQLAVLVDRGHRELPIRADYVGKNVPTSSEEEVTVQLREVDDLDAVVIGQTGRAAEPGSGMA